MILPPATCVVSKDQHMDLRSKIERFFNAQGCVGRMDIYSRGDSETVYIEFKQLPSTEKNQKERSKLLSGELRIESYVLRPQLVLS